jgi:hypothetical protein
MVSLARKIDRSPYDGFYRKATWFAKFPNIPLNEIAEENMVFIIVV